MKLSEIDAGELPGPGPARGLDGIAEALRGLRSSIYALGNGNAATEFGAVENLAKEVQEGTLRVADALGGIADGLHAIADAIQEDTRARRDAGP